MTRRSMTMEEQYWRKSIGDQIAAFTDKLLPMIVAAVPDVPVSTLRALESSLRTCEDIARGDLAPR